MPNIVGELVGRVLVSVAKGVPTDDEWAAYVELVRSTLAVPGARALAITDGEPTAKQRGELLAVTKGHALPVALVTSSKTSLLLATAVSWFHPELRVFGPDDMARAYRYLGLSPEEETQVRLTVRKLDSSRERPDQRR